MCCGWRLEGPGALARERGGGVGGSGSSGSSSLLTQMGKKYKYMQCFANGYGRLSRCLHCLACDTGSSSDIFQWQMFSAKVERNLPTTVRCSDSCLGVLWLTSRRNFVGERFGVYVHNLPTVCPFTFVISFVCFALTLCSDRGNDVASGWTHRCCRDLDMC